MTDPEQWPRFFPLPAMLEDMLAKHQSLEFVLPWKNFKAELLNTDLIGAVVEQWLDSFCQIGVRVFKRTPDTEQGLKMFRFQRLAAAVQATFFAFDTEPPVRQISSQLTSLFNSLDSKKRSRAHDRVRLLYSTVVFESVIASFEKSGLLPSDNLHGVVDTTLRKSAEIDELLTEEPGWAQKRADYDRAIENLQIAHRLLQQMAEL